MATIGTIKRQKMEAALNRRLVRGAKKQAAKQQRAANKKEESK